MLVTLLIAADLAGSLAVSDRTEARVRAPGTAPAAASFDLETAPAVELKLASRRSRVALAYAPRLTLWDVSSTGVRPALLHGGAAHVEWQSHRVRLSLDQAGSYGGVSFASISLTPGPEGALPRLDALPAPRLIQFASSTTTLASRLTLRRWLIDMSLGYQLSGGADAGARAVLPFQAGPSARMTAEYEVSRRDHVATTASASEAAFSSGSESILTEVDESFRHLLSRLTEARFTLGVSEARVRTSETASPVFGSYPVVEAVFEHHPTPEGHIDVRLGARLGPVVNRLVGLVDERVEGSLAVSHTYRRLTTHAFVSGSQSVPASGANATSLVVGELGTAYGVSRLVALDAGVRGLWQHQEVAQIGFAQGTLFFGVTFRAPPIRL